MVEFIVVPNSYTVKAKPRQDYEEEDPLPTIPWLDVLVCSCNCSSFPRIGNIVVNANNGNTENPYELELSDDCESEKDIPGDIEVSIQESDSDEQDDIMIIIMLVLLPMMTMMMAINVLKTLLKSSQNILPSKVAATMKTVKKH